MSASDPAGYVLGLFTGEVFAGAFLGALVGFIISWFFSRLTGRQLSREAARLRRLNEMLINTAEEHGYLKVKRNSKGEVVGRIMELSAKFEIEAATKASADAARACTTQV